MDRSQDSGTTYTEPNESGRRPFPKTSYSTTHDYGSETIERSVVGIFATNRLHARLDNVKRHCSVHGDRSGESSCDSRAKCASLGRAILELALNLFKQELVTGEAHDSVGALLHGHGYKTSVQT
jgi:hypothetical protein